MFSVADKTVCITGSSRGLGKSLARGFAANGSKVVISSFDSEELQQAKNEFAADNLGVEAVVADVTRRQDCELLINRAIDRLGSLDVLICNAGIDIIKPAESYAQSEWDRIIDTNLRGYFYCAQFAGRHMLANKKGSIIMTSSIAGSLGVPGLAPYAASKGGINQLVRTMAVEWAPKGVRVNAVAPGYIENIMTGVRYDENDPYQRRAIEFTPMGRRGAMEEFVGAYIFLASEAASFVTGEVIYVDGGYHAT
jgi:NAD(P)-dependent dehydrogenase (short-subunit alcohol dehydrogenase family)